MLFVDFLYKGAILHTHVTGLKSTEENKVKVKEQLLNKQIPFPENWDKWELRTNFTTN